MSRWTLWREAAAPFAVAAALCAGTAASAGLGSQSSAPIDITANEAEAVNSKCLGIWRGAAEALQDKARLRADTITVHFRVKSTGADGKPVCGGTESIEADGHVYYVTAERRARGDHAVYSADADEITLTGDVIVVQGNDVARAEKLVIKVSTREARMESSVVGPNKAGRVRGVFYPDKANAKAGDPAQK